MDQNSRMISLFESIDDALESDVISTIGDLTILVPEESYENLDGATLDLPSNPMQGGASNSKS